MKIVPNHVEDIWESSSLFCLIVLQVFAYFLCTVCTHPRVNATINLQTKQAKLIVMVDLVTDSPHLCTRNQADSLTTNLFFQEINRRYVDLQHFYREMLQKVKKKKRGRERDGADRIMVLLAKDGVISSFIN